MLYYLICCTTLYAVLPYMLCYLIFCTTLYAVLPYMFYHLICCLLRINFLSDRCFNYMRKYVWPTNFLRVLFTYISIFYLAFTKLIFLDPDTRTAKEKRKIHSKQNQKTARRESEKRSGIGKKEKVSLSIHSPGNLL